MVAGLLAVPKAGCLGKGGRGGSPFCWFLTLHPAEPGSKDNGTFRASVY